MVFLACLPISVSDPFNIAVHDDAIVSRLIDSNRTTYWNPAAQALPDNIYYNQFLFSVELNVSYIRIDMIVQESAH